MEKTSGMKWNIVALILAGISLFITFYDVGSYGVFTYGVRYQTFKGINSFVEFFSPQYFVDHLLVWTNPTYFSSPVHFFNSLLILFPLFFIAAAICLLAGIKTTGGPAVAAVILLLYPVYYIVCVVLLEHANFSTVQAGAYLMLAAGILAILGTVANRGESH